MRNWEESLIERWRMRSTLAVTMRLFKYALMACTAAVLAGCYTNRDSQGRPFDEQVAYSGRASSDALIEGPNRGVNTNYFGPINSGAEAAWGPGTPSGGSVVQPRP